MEHAPSLDTQFARFRTETSAHRGRFHGLILLGTMQHPPTTAALLIDALQPARVAFLLTPYTRDQDVPARVATEIGGSPHTWLIPPDTYESADEVYRGLKYILHRWPDLAPATIAADATGGFATMSVGLAKAAHILGLTTLYVRSDYGYIDGRYRYLPGTQRLEFPPDPYTVFGDLEAQEAQRLFASHDYAGAQRIFTTLSQRVPAPACHDYRAYTHLATAYAAWDTFDWQHATAALTALLADPLPSDLAPDTQCLQDQHTALRQLQADTTAWERKPTLKLLADQNRVLPLLGTLDANAQRRAAQARYDVAALFHYRCLELIAQHRLATWDILTERPDYAHVLRRVPNLDQRYRDVETTLFRTTRGLDRDGRPISLFNGYMLLTALADPLIQDMALPLKQIQERTKARNKSMLAHGFRLITRQEYEAFRAIVDDMLDRFFAVMPADRAAWAHCYQFVCPFAPEPQQP